MRRLSPSIPLQLVVLFSLVPGAVGPSAAAETPSTTAAVTPEEIETDWLAQIPLRYQLTPTLARDTPLPYRIAPEQDAAGGCDGVINGTWGFHTDSDNRPWWQVDLQREFLLEKVVIHNSGYQEEWKRILGFTILLSVDGKSYGEAFRHNERPFQDPKQAIVVPLNRAAARYVKIQLPGKQHLTLEEVEVYSVGKTENVALHKPANQSSASKWSVRDFNPWSSDPIPPGPSEYPVTKIVEQGLKLAADLRTRGIALQTMRSLTYVQQGQTYSCIGCHEHRRSAAPNVRLTAAFREPSPIDVGPEGTWPLDYQTMVQPMLDRHCVKCHKPGGEASETDLTPARSYAALMGYGGERSLATHVQARYDARRSVAGQCAAMASPLTALLDEDHFGDQLSAGDFERLFIWMDTYGQRSGSHDSGQEEELRKLKTRLAPLLTLSQEDEEGPR